MFDQITVYMLFVFAIVFLLAYILYRGVMKGQKKTK